MVESAAMTAAVPMKLRKALERTLKAGHPWVYRDALERPEQLEAGAEVVIHDRRGRPFARGIADGGDAIGHGRCVGRRRAAGLAGHLPGQSKHDTNHQLPDELKGLRQGRAL